MCGLSDLRFKLKSCRVERFYCFHQKMFLLVTSFFLGKTAFEKRQKRKGDLRKRDSNWDPTSEDYTGPWAKYKDEVTVSVPSEEDRVYLEAYLAKKASKRKVVEEAPIEEKSTLVLGKDGKSVDEIVNLHRLRWLGHMLRMPEHRLPRRAMLTGVRDGWKKVRGGQTKTWHQCLKSLTSSLSHVGGCRLLGWGPRDCWLIRHRLN
ncbi:unnamed protein product [Schistosoma margrebowiei]|uniref:Uncharacterized protein n=1 Tax=Schistosoma margrebowiei TaxID=48269 RepID=A0A3P8BH98_9TREM|nr:unnamed protein product [Schistosoma margrebowiei]